MIKKKYDIFSIEKLSSVALELLKLSHNRIFAIHGELGVGKTTLVKQLCNHLNVIDSVSSPTFSIVNEYIDVNGEKIFHFDLYRVNDVSELNQLGIDIYIDSGRYCFIEWPALLEPLLLDNCTVIKMIKKTNKRELLLLE